MSPWLVPVFVAGFVFMGDLLAPCLLWLWYRTVLLVVRPTASPLAKRTIEQASDGVRSIKPPKSVQYLRQHWHVPHKERRVEESKVVGGLDKCKSEVLSNNILDMVDRPLLEPGQKHPAELSHAGILARLKARLNHKPSERGEGG